eukprot:TRINITY_DN14641_c0_g1_i1.p1 TRINITY_DN14641_c0_g1~~TRINITY_DN14641_c0_g1_i1.p1  ORF type:complete len:319 (+),score=64.15 TRINITY_DN14641_c0_g1_i1:119-1075(+)
MCIRDRACPQVLPAFPRLTDQPPAHPVSSASLPCSPASRPSWSELPTHPQAGLVSPRPPETVLEDHDLPDLQAFEAVYQGTKAVAREHFAAERKTAAAEAESSGTGEECHREQLGEVRQRCNTMVEGSLNEGSPVPARRLSSSVPWHPFSPVFRDLVQDAAARIARDDGGLVALDLAAQSVGEPGVSAISAALQRNTVLRDLDLGGNFIGDKGGTVLGQALACNHTLAVLRLDSSCIGSQGAAGLSVGLTFNHSLTVLHLGGNPIQDAGAEELAGALEGNEGVAELGLHGCNINSQGCLLYTSPSPRDRTRSRMPSSA